MPEFQKPELSPKVLRERRAKISAEMRTMADRITADGHVETDDEKRQWAEMNTDYNALTRRIEIAERVDALNADRDVLTQDPAIARRASWGGDGGANLVEVEGVRLGTREQVQAQALAGWMAMSDADGPTREMQLSMRLCGINPAAKSLRIKLHENDTYNRLQSNFRNMPTRLAMERSHDFRATVMTVGAGDSGGYLIAPEQLRNQLELNMLYFGGVRQVAENFRTATGEPITWPTADDTSNTGEQIGESTDISTISGGTTNAGGPLPTLGVKSWTAYDLHSKMILVPKNLLRDSVFNVPTVLGQMLGERLGRVTNTKFTTGTGAATLTGIITDSGSYSAASATAIAFDDILKLEHSIDIAYRNMPGVGFMMHDSICLQLRLLKDGNGQYIWKSNEPAGLKDTLDNYPYTINNDMDSTIASGKKTVLFGHFPSYKIRTVGQVEIIRLDERFAEYRRVAFDAFTSEDAKLLTSGTARIKYLSH